MADKDTPELIAYRLELLESSITGLSNKMDKIIDNYATKEDLSKVKSEVDEVSKKKVLTAMLASVISIISSMITVLTLYEHFRH
jgi:hypothetical protein|nr:MAG TPA: hypothetical protein [Caudoviricetes sp.]